MFSTAHHSTWMALALSPVVENLFTPLLWSLFYILCRLSSPCAGVSSGPPPHPLYLFSHGLLPGDLFASKAVTSTLSGGSQICLDRPPSVESTPCIHSASPPGCPAVTANQTSAKRDPQGSSLTWPSFHTSPTKINIHWAQDQKHLSYPWHTHTPKLTTSNLQSSPVHCSS